ncbi:hypothetical protein F8388_018754 [Cannabis sativa]|uniref:Protein kinase domain-containing protein n=1 Tax=Cannabis sativa TaxID=3483 RepID=A0A7J6GM93_CANSA|nr:hypothetical protein F8388_018754 [Cannabis sativa]
MRNVKRNLTQHRDRRYVKKQVSGVVESVLWFSCGVRGVEIIVILIVWLFVIGKNENSSLDNIQAGYLLAATGFKKFRTNGFNLEIGRGAGGIVYKAILSNNRGPAVKKITDTNQGEVEFYAEVSTIGTLNQMNLIEMWGYCAEGKHRLLVYEYMEHGSLCDIAIGTAKGLAYLHEECLEWVLHCDVKPHNILLGSSYEPKVADFGLSKLLNRDEHGGNSSFFTIRGTRGYIATSRVFYRNKQLVARCLRCLESNSWDYAPDCSMLSMGIREASGCRQHGFGARPPFLIQREFLWLAKCSSFVLVVLHIFLLPLLFRLLLHSVGWLNLASGPVGCRTLLRRIVRSVSSGIRAG